ncbi:MAG: SRPBCC family protein [Calditrichaeota bacterium]|nr:MAG: SRPBCC family protein [Calditrichota bacterium]
MRYTVEIDIDLPRAKVIELFDNPDNMKYWQKGFISLEHISGEPGREGARSRLKYKMGNREIEMIETITKRNLPDEFSGTYETQGVWNLNKNYFLEPSPGSTRWRADIEFKFNGFMKVIAFLIPGSFKKQSLTYMKDFKTFAEMTS